MIKDYCNYDMKCIKDEVMNKIKNLKQEKPLAEEKRSKQSDQPEIVEGFFNGLTSFLEVADQVARELLFRKIRCHLI